MKTKQMDEFEKWLQERIAWAGSQDRYDYGIGLLDALAKFRALRAEDSTEHDETEWETIAWNHGYSVYSGISGYWWCARDYPYEQGGYCDTEADAWEAACRDNNLLPEVKG